jgi:hypothetical protein
MNDQEIKFIDAESGCYAGEIVFDKLCGKMMYTIRTTSDEYTLLNSAALREIANELDKLNKEIS